MTEGRTQFIIGYGLDHVPLLKEYAQKGVTVLALDRHLEYLLEEQQIPYISAKQYRGTRQFERIVRAETIVNDLCNSPDWAFFSYRSISLTEIFRFSIQEYLDFFFYYVALFVRVAEAHPDSEWIVLPPANPPPRSGGPLATHMHEVVMDAARLVASETGISATFRAPTYSDTTSTLRAKGFSLTRELSGLLLNLFTRVVTCGARKKGKRILTSDHWRNIKTVIQDLPEVELSVCERSEVRYIPWWTIRSYRMRFFNLGTRVTAAQRKKLASVHQAFVVSRERLTIGPTPCEGVDIAPQLSRVLTTIVATAALPVLNQIEHAYEVLRSIDLVLLRTSVSGQTHHVALALVAREMRVPAVELQHGLEYLGPGSLSRRHTAEYIATYGPAISRELESMGYDAGRLLPVGSPRFDAYAQVEPRKDGAVLCVGPDIYPGGSFDSYDAEEYLKTFFDAVPATERTIVKLRGTFRNEFFTRAIARHKGLHSPKIATAQPFTEILADVRCVVSCYSTAILETLQCGIPTVQLILGDFDYATSIKHFQSYTDAGVLKLCRGTQALREGVTDILSGEGVPTRSRNTKVFMDQAFCFDGHSSERFVEVLVRLMSAHE
ncbi:MAG: hypothetical protein RLZZ26_418 [Candidatus Parcubacteria bacterium]